MLRLRHLFTLALAVFALRAIAGESASFDEQARFIAGLPVRGTALEPASLSKAWAEHAATLDASWQRLDRTNLSRIREWAPQFLPEAVADRGPLFYMFSGPDFLYAHTFFPNAGTYILCGIEPIGDIPDVAKLSPELLASSLALLRESLDPVLNFGFFISKKMRAEFAQNKLSGVLPVLYIFLERSGCHVDDVRLVGLDKEGAFTEGKTLAPAVKILFTTPGHEQQTLYYFSTNLADDGVTKSGFLKWCDTLGEGRSFLKAASYLMHEGGFETVRKFLLSHSKTLVQDDSAIPLKYFAAAQWNLRLFGAYPGPIEIFKQHTQPALADLYRSANPPRLPFGFGYRWHASESTLIVAEKKSTEQTSVKK